VSGDDQGLLGKIEGKRKERAHVEPPEVRVRKFVEDQKKRIEDNTQRTRAAVKGRPQQS
jgi:hypothetical protein